MRVANLDSAVRLWVDPVAAIGGDRPCSHNFTAYTAKINNGGQVKASLAIGTMSVGSG